MGWESCLTEIRQAAGVDFSDAELAKILEDVLARKAAALARGAGRLSDAEALRQAAGELSAEIRLNAAIEKRNALLNLQARIARRRRILDAPDPVLGIQAEIHGVNTPLPGGRFSAEAEWKALSNVYRGRLTTELEREGLFATARSGALEREWTRELFELSKGEDGRPGITGVAPALAIARLVRDVQERARDALNRAGAWIGDYQGYISRTAHDPDAIRKAGFAGWRAVMLEKLDQGRTFDGVEDPERFLAHVYHALVTGVHLTEDGSRGFKDPAFTGPGNLAAKLSSERVLHWRDADAWVDYQQRFGIGNPMAAVLGALDRAAQSTALMRRWGTNPRAEFQNELRWLQESLRDRKPDQVIQLRARERDLWNRFDALDGTANQPANRLGARVGSAVRVIESMAKLGGVAFTHLSSGVTKAAELRYHGVGLLEGYGDFLKSFARGRGEGETREVMDLIGAGLEGMQRDILGRFETDDTVPGMLSKWANTYFKWTGLTYLLNAQKAGAEFTMARRLGSRLDLGHEALEPQARRLLKLYGIRPAEWEMLRQAPDHASIEDRPFLTPDAAQRVDAAAAEAHLRALGVIGEKATPATIAARLDAFREDLALRIHAMYHDIADRAIVTPGVPEKALLTQGLHPGTIGGEALRFLAQFKQWPAAAIRQGLGREIYGGQGAFMAAAGIFHMTLASVIVGYLAMSGKDFVKGRKPRDPLAPATWAAALMQGGGAGILGDFMFGEFNRFGQNFAETLAGPVLGQGVGTVMDLWNRIKAKATDPERHHDIAPEFLRFVADNAPFVNLLYIRTALNYLFLYQVQEALNPGFLRRFERRVQEQNHQTFWWRPTHALGAHQ